MNGCKLNCNNSLTTYTLKGHMYKVTREVCVDVDEKLLASYSVCFRLPL